VSNPTRNPIYRRAILAAGLALLTVACGKELKVDAAAEAPPANTQVEHVGDPDRIKVDHPEQFPVTVAGAYESLGELNVTGSVAADVSRAVPVISMAAGRVLEVHAKLGDTVTKGQLLMRIQSADISNAFSDYRQAVADETLARAQLERAKMLLDRGAIAQKDHEVAVDTAAKARITVENTQERLRLHGADLNHPSSIIDVVAPISGVITDQQVTAAAGVQGLASPNPFTISDLSSVWILCDVYENDLKNVRVGEYASVRLNAYPDQVFQGRVSNIASSLDPALRTARVRLEMKNPGNMRIGMFVTAAFKGTERKTHASVPSSAILHLHDHDWVYVPADGNGFRRVEVSGGKMLPSNMQEVLSGIAPGEKVVSNALVLQNTSEQ
jgi:cobalt-zinc-cadmium efflux system membrane fusion protein